MRDAACAACLSHAFLRSWRCHPNLTLNWKTFCPMLDGRDFCCNVDNILRNHSRVGLKILKLNLCGDDSTFPCIDSWLKIAVTPGIEELNLRLYKKYNFPCSVFSDPVRNSIRHLQLSSCTFRPTAKFGPLKSLTSLHLHSVHITGDEIECLLSNTIALEQLQLDCCKEITILKIPCVLQQFRCLSVAECWSLQVIQSNAPNLSSIDFSGEIKLVLGEALKMKHLCMDCSDVIFYARSELPSYSVVFMSHTRF
ncbi:hypothetical protein PR202_ga23276 [Eleusine coracana subsp. coracana]|uniref:At1g61320/AtMIF1 LRR domain-containing protein n=1 Tax=Eleusine coracana subsp. coracana TaxID=191504 RepID=A0AAV5D5U6_ELECO|nr:hypothetical protein PR202_ga23276 [Eleusine coracana subsp. coracana]